VLASQGYPEHPRTGDTIEGLNGAGQSVAAVEGVTVFHAGTRRHSPDGPVPHGRRARAGGDRGGADAGHRPASAPYAATEPIDWEGMQMRHDIAALVAGSPVGAGEGTR